MNSHDTMCERCDWLCCQVYDIFDTESGKHVKKAWEKCGHLDTKNKCRIYNTRSKHAGFKESCDIYDCLEAGPIVTIFARRISDDFPMKYAIISSLLETIRTRIIYANTPEEWKKILDFTASILMYIKIDEKIHLSVKVARIKIQLWIEPDTTL